MAAPAPLVLAFDTSGPWIAVALTRGTRVLAQAFEDMARGQAERLMPLLEAALAEGATPLAALDALAVGVGPGNFTGIRISVAAARGLALALGIPAIGVSGFEALRGARSLRDAAPQIVTLEGPRGGLYLQRFAQGRADGPPRFLPDGPGTDPAAPGLAADAPILGPMADILADRLAAAHGTRAPAARVAALPLPDLGATLARIAADILADSRASGRPIPRPAPLYVRPADAAPPRDPGPVLL